MQFLSIEHLGLEFLDRFAGLDVSFRNFTVAATYNKPMTK